VTAEMGPRMQSQPGFARLLLLMALIGLAAGTLALLASARPVAVSVSPTFASPLPSPRAGIRDAFGKEWNLEDLKPGATLVGADLRAARWRGVDLRGAKLAWCDLRHADLSGADLRGAWLLGVDLAGAKLDGTRLEATLFSSETRWPTRFDPGRHLAYDVWWEHPSSPPAGFDPREHGARLKE
jgi:pentapeptide repeat protein